MESQQKDPEFSLSKDGKAKVEYNKFRFVFHSHKDKYTKISLGKKEMKLLISLLPEFQRKAKELFNFDDVEPADVPTKKAKTDVVEVAKTVENKDWKMEVLSKYKQYETRLTLNTYDEVAYVWLLLLFDEDYEKNKADEDCQATSRKRKQVTKETKWKTCFGGVILNDVNVADLNRFVRKCLQS